MNKDFKSIRPNKHPVLFFENNDSFSWNVIDALPFSRADITIVPHHSNYPFTETPKAIIIGPGPMDPFRAGLIDVVRFGVEKQIPILGICLGFQALGVAFGAKLIRTTPMHGKRSLVVFSPSRFFPAFNGPVEVMRYHSLSLNEINAPLNTIASTIDGIPMAVEHESLPIAGFQFHPDSFATKRGIEMFQSFFENAL